MGDLTLNDIALSLTLVVGLITSTAYINKTLKSWFTKQLNVVIEPLVEKITKVEMDSCKNYLSRCLADVERGEQMSETEKERFWETYENYLKNGGNSYLKHKVDKLIAENKL